MTDAVLAAHAAAAATADAAIDAFVAGLPLALTHRDGDALDKLRESLFLACRVGIAWCFTETGDYQRARELLRMFRAYFPDSDFEGLLFLFSGHGVSPGVGEVGYYSDYDDLDTALEDVEFSDLADSFYPGC